MVNLSHLAVPETGQEQKPGAGIFPETDPVEKDQRRARQLVLHWHQLFKGGLLRAGALLCTQAIPWLWAAEFYFSPGEQGITWVFTMETDCFFSATQGYFTHPGWSSKVNKDRFV